MSRTQLSKSGREMLEDAREKLDKTTASLRSAESSVETVKMKMGGSAPLALERAHRALKEGDCEEAAEQLDQILGVNDAE